MIADRRLYLTADKSEVVEEGDVRAAFLFATPGTEISDADAERLGLTEAAAPEPAPEPVGEDVEEKPKRRKPAANKARKATPNK